MPSFRLIASALFRARAVRHAGRIGAEFFRQPARRHRDHRQNYLIAHPRGAGRGDGRIEQAAGRRRDREARGEHRHQCGGDLPTRRAAYVLGNKDGDVTFVEFFDYNCGYCKRAMADMLDLLKTDPKNSRSC